MNYAISLKINKENHEIMKILKVRKRGMRKRKVVMTVRGRNRVRTEIIWDKNRSKRKRMQWREGIGE